MAPTSSAARGVVDTVAEPVLPDTATTGRDEVVSWNFATPVVDERVRHYVLGNPPNGFDVALGYESTSSSPLARSMTGIFAAGSAVDPLITVTITSPGIGGTPTLEGVTGEPTSVGNVPAVRRILGVNGAGLAFVVGKSRIDVVAKSTADTWLEPLAASIKVDGSSVSVRPPDGSGLKFVGAYSPGTPVADGLDLIGLYFQAQTTSVKYSNGNGQIGLVVTTGRVVGAESLHAWFEPRANPIEIAGQTGWIVRLPNSSLTIIGWMAAGRMFQLSGNVPEKALLTLAEGVRPATADEWSQVTSS
jgi:hypothetical protein